METFENQQNKSRVGLWIVLATLPILVIIGAVILWTAGSGSPDSETRQAATGSSSNEAVKATLTDQGVSPSTITVKKGQTITWTNTGDKTWQLAADTASLPRFDTAQGLVSGDSFSYTFEKTGTYSYYDAFDPTNYNATVIVQ